jgi:Fe-Mn family superoxide dismutase
MVVIGCPLCGATQLPEASLVSEYVRIPEIAMPDISRRSLAAGAGLLAGALTLPITGRRAMAQQVQQIATAATAPKFRVQPLTYNAEKISGLSAKAITNHHGEHYANVVNQLNAVTEQLVKLDLAQTPPATVGDLKRQEHIAYNATVLHELYFECLGEAPTQPSGVFAQALARDFGSLDRWRAEFVAMGKAEGGGSGWVILAWSPRDRRLINCWSQITRPILRAASRSSCSTCMSMLITWIMAPRPVITSKPT